MTAEAERQMHESIRLYRAELAPKPKRKKQVCQVIVPPQVFEAVVEAVASSLGLTVKYVTSKTHEWPGVRARSIAMLILSERGYSLSAIGRSFERHHTSVMGALRTQRRHLVRYAGYEGRIEAARAAVMQWVGQTGAVESPKEAV